MTKNPPDWRPEPSPINFKQWYYLHYRKVVQCQSMRDFYSVMGDGEKSYRMRRIRLTYVGDVKVSTVFLGLDHGFAGNNDGRPVVFETMTFDRNHKSVDMERCSIHRQALKMHRDMVAIYKDKLKNG